MESEFGIFSLSETEGHHRTSTSVERRVNGHKSLKRKTPTRAGEGEFLRAGCEEPIPRLFAKEPSPPSLRSANSPFLGNAVGIGSSHGT